MLAVCHTPCPLLYQNDVGKGVDEGDVDHHMSFDEEKKLWSYHNGSTLYEGDQAMCTLLVTFVRTHS